MARMISSERFTERGIDRTDRVVEQLRPAVRPLAGDRDLEPLLARIGDARYVLLGEASHGTSDFYTWRSRLSQRLIREKGFTFIAVEGDWPDCYRVNRYVKSRSEAGSSASEVLHAFDRWPTWMWANREVVELAEWLHAHNAPRPEKERVGFYGLDVYSLWDSMREVVSYLDRVEPEAGRRARHAYECFAPYTDDEQAYARATMLVPVSCENAVVDTLSQLRRRASLYQEDGREAYFNADQNALVTKNAELYYRTMVRGGSSSWNVRDTHMVETLERLLMEFHGPDSEVGWSHRSC